MKIGRNINFKIPKVFDRVEYLDGPIRVSVRGEDEQHLSLTQMPAVLTMSVFPPSVKYQY